MTQILRSRNSILEAIDSNLAQSSILAMYDSRIKGIITDKALMSVPIDDHMVHRGHAVFDTLTVYNGKAYNLSRHLASIFYSSSLAKIDPPLSEDSMKQILLDLAACTGKLNLSIRYWISAGPGSMAIWPVSNHSTFYAIALENNKLLGFSSINESTVTIPIKPRYLAIMKSTNYLINALCAMEAKEKGGHYGIQTDENGYITEGSVNNVCFILPNKYLVTPTFHKILNGTTIERVLKFCEVLVENQLIAGVEQRDIHISEAKTAIEMFVIGGDTISTVNSWDGVEIGTGVEGAITSQLKEMLIKDLENPDLTIPIEYSKYIIA
jgi:4-amino-4-deoxychorismate lyase